MSTLLGAEKFKRVKGEYFHKAGRLVWLVGDRVTVNRRDEHPLGKVLEDSMDPEEWVKVELFNKGPYVTWMNRKNRQDFHRKLRKKRKPVRKVDRAFVWIKSKGVCFYCGIKTVFEGPKNFEKPKPNQFTVDHRRPVKMGGKENPSNLVGACQECNTKKKDMAEEEFRIKYAGYLKTKGKTNGDNSKEG